jgi:uncharacterized protein (DUF488 family)
MIFTIGYEHATPKSLLAELEKAGVKTLIDVRELPASRRPGFSKRALAAELARHDIRYEHLRGLGTPKEGRIANRAKDFKTFWRIVSEGLKSAEGKKDLARAEEIVQAERTALLCLEASPETCHRSKVAEILSKRTGQKVRHLHVELAGTSCASA